MNLEFLQTEVLPKRLQEIKEGKNCATNQPIYVVLDLQENFVSGHSDYSPPVNHKGKGWDFGYIDNFYDGDEREFKESPHKMCTPYAVTRFYTDRIISFHLTSESAHDYLKYQSHNLEDAYVYVFYSGYGNKQMNTLLDNQ